MKGLLNTFLIWRRGEQSRNYGQKINLKYGICNILNEQCVYFKTLMTSEGINTDTAKQLLANVETMVSLYDNEMLDGEINLEEIAESIYTFNKSQVVTDSLQNGINYSGIS